MELDLFRLFGLLCIQLYSLAKTPQLPHSPPHLVWSHIRGRYWSAKTDDISLKLPEFNDRIIV